MAAAGSRASLAVPDPLPKDSDAGRRKTAEEFLAQPHVAAAGVSRDTKQPANLIWRLRASGHEVFAVNPNADEVDGDRCYPDNASIPQRLDGVVIVTTPAVAEDLVADRAAAGVPRVWVHRGIGPGSHVLQASIRPRGAGQSVVRGSGARSRRRSRW
jgi:predicted CoA-binding protein